MANSRSAKEETGTRRLDSWGEIAAYIRRDLSTAMRWEKKRGLPVHRVPGGERGTVYAYPQEIDNWLLGTENGDSAFGVGETKESARGSGLGTGGWGLRKNRRQKAEGRRQK